ncbi:MAG TPA: enoyl-CoA hydratase/isomerase family protein [Chloroflexi bacterium]|nr:enoyl-CoA hydratase/isomerase family protein [Chloroflexota bacterium]
MSGEERGEVLFSLSGDGVGVITVNRPQVRNALNRAAMRGLEDAIGRAERASGLRALILTGAGQTFISGGDIRDLHSRMSESDGLHQHDLMTAILSRLETLPVPVIAALEGATRGGGCEVALACDLRFAAEDATLGFVQVRMGVTPGWGGARRLYELVGYSRAMDLLLSGRILTAHEALELGLVNRLTAPGRALEAARSLASEIARGPALAIRGIKEVLSAYRTLPAAQAAERERAIFGRLWASADHAGASAAFLEKRPPVFRGE